jgi:hypothetical protein
MNRSILFVLVYFLTASQLNAQPSQPDEWETLFEKSNYLRTPRYEETMDYFDKFQKASPYAHIFTFGLSPQGRELKCLVVSKDRAFTSIEAKKTNKLIILIVNGIHSGEIEGKDASMLLLREILVTKEKEHYLDKLILLVVPIFNVDGHERMSRYNRINQNGPEEMGWRVTAQNLNLNRDWMKADAPEMQAMLKLFSNWLPDFFIDSHTTNGADYQYTITYAMEKFQNFYYETADWVMNEFIPYLEEYVNKSGYLIAPYVGFKDGKLEKGIVDWAASPRLSEGYAALQNRPALLIETHMLKPFKERVFATKVMFETAMDFVFDNDGKLIELNRRADANSAKMFSIDKEPFPLRLTASNEFENFIFKGIKFIKEQSSVSGKEKTVYTGEKFDLEIPFYNKMKVSETITAPKAYLIPSEWNEIVERIKIHGVNVEVLKKEKTFNVKKYKFKNVKFSQSPYEGRQRISFDYDELQGIVSVPAGTFFINTNQRAVRVILHLLEPKADDSFINWGFFNTIFERKEYFEDYVMEKMALQMLENNAGLKSEFEKRLAEDESFRDNPYERLNFFYERSPYFDSQFLIYPVMRID